MNFEVNFIKNNENVMGDFQVAQGLELQHLRRLSGALRRRITTKSREMVSSLLLFESTRLHFVRRRFRRSFWRTKTEDSHHVCITQLHNFHSHRP